MFSVVNSHNVNNGNCLYALVSGNGGVKVRRGGGRGGGEGWERRKGWGEEGVGGPCKFIMLGKYGRAKGKYGASKFIIFRN